jgi:death on curing protein
MIWWVDSKLARFMHDELIAEHGGLPGIRDKGLLESALARPQNLSVYDPASTLPQLAAALACGVLRNHPFADGNKRVALMCAYTFLGINGLRLTAPQEEAHLMTLNAASGALSEDGYAAWLARSVEPF